MCGFGGMSDDRSTQHPWQPDRQKQQTAVTEQPLQQHQQQETFIRSGSQTPYFNGIDANAGEQSQSLHNRTRSYAGPLCQEGQLLANTDRYNDPQLYLETGQRSLHQGQHGMQLARKCPDSLLQQIRNHLAAVGQQKQYSRIEQLLCGQHQNVEPTGVCSSSTGSTHDVNQPRARTITRLQPTGTTTELSYEEGGNSSQSASVVHSSSDMTILSESRLRGRDLVAERRRTEEQIQQQDQLLCTEEQEAAHSLLRLGRNLPPVIRNEAGFDYDYQPSRRIPSEVVVPPLLTPNAERIPVEQQHYQQERHRCQNHGGEKEHRQSRRSTGGKRSSRRNVKDHHLMTEIQRVKRKTTKRESFREKTAINTERINSRIKTAVIT